MNRNTGNRTDFSIRGDDWDKVQKRQNRIGRLFGVTISKNDTDRTSNIVWLTVEGTSDADVKKAKTVIVALCNPQCAYPANRTLDAIAMEHVEKEYQVVVVPGADPQKLIIQGSEEQVALAFSFLDTVPASVIREQYSKETAKLSSMKITPTRVARDEAPSKPVVGSSDDPIVISDDENRRASPSSTSYQKKFDGFHRTLASIRPVTTGSVETDGPEARRVETLSARAQQAPSTSKAQPDLVKPQQSITDAYTIAVAHGFTKTDVNQLGAEVATKLSGAELVEKLRLIKNKRESAAASASSSTKPVVMHTLIAQQRPPAATATTVPLIPAAAKRERSRSPPHHRRRSPSPERYQPRESATAAPGGYPYPELSGARNGPGPMGAHVSLRPDTAAGPSGWTEPNAVRADRSASSSTAFNRKSRWDTSPEGEKPGFRKPMVTSLRPQENGIPPQIPRVVVPLQPDNGASRTRTVSEGAHNDKDDRLRHVVIDGSNVAMDHGNHRDFSSRGIEVVVDFFRKRGHKDITVFVPRHRQSPLSSKNPEILEDLNKEGIVRFTPSWKYPGQKMNVCYDDRWTVQLAAERDGIIVTNDNYKDLLMQDIPQEWRYTILNRILRFCFVGDTFMPAFDPTARRDGPTLDQFLSLDTRRSHRGNELGRSTHPQHHGPSNGGGAAGGGPRNGARDRVSPNQSEPSENGWKGPRRNKSPRSEVETRDLQKNLLQIFPEEGDVITRILAQHKIAKDLNYLCGLVLGQLDTGS